jgi:hypothetical protein
VHFPGKIEFLHPSSAPSGLDLFPPFRFPDFSSDNCFC